MAVVSSLSFTFLLSSAFVARPTGQARTVRLLAEALRIDHGRTGMGIGRACIIEHCSRPKVQGSVGQPDLAGSLNQSLLVIELCAGYPPPRRKSFLLLYCGCVLAAITPHKSSRRFPFPLRDISDAVGYPAAEVDLLRRVRPGVGSRAEGIQFAAGDPESGPSLSLEFGPRADVRFPYRLVLPSVLFRDFALHAVFRPYRAGRDLPEEVGFARSLSRAEHEADEEFLFAVLNPSETVVQLGLALGDGDSRVTLYYTDVSMHLTSQRLAEVGVFPTSPPLLCKKQTNLRSALRLSVTATGNEVSLQLLNCTTLEDVRLAQHVTRIPKELAFDGASTLYLSQAGPILGGRFVGRLQTLRLFSVPVLVPLCQDTIGFQGEKGEPGAKGEPAALAGIDPDLLFPQVRKETKETKDAEAGEDIQVLQVLQDLRDHLVPRYDDSTDDDYDVSVADVASSRRQVVTWKDLESLLKSSALMAPGTLAFVLDSEAFLIKVSRGWRQLPVSPRYAEPS
ncbi:hypothetical protein HPB47_010235 [Ixodes persulcatus]|uniref:Uncharacterized protein n=1 Tax=Ixodes persulcatus TaxID=34615 RepID=A0AC60NZP0_IXOPE|nr:hypothetical protein HPB47_010235 [Ixodes persulcatus]